MIRVESEETQDYARGAKSAEHEEEEERTFVPSAVSVPLKPVFRVNSVPTVQSCTAWSHFITRTRVMKCAAKLRIAHLCVLENNCHPRAMSRPLPHLTLTTRTSSLSPMSSTSPISPTVSPLHTSPTPHKEELKLVRHSNYLRFEGVLMRQAFYAGKSGEWSKLLGSILVKWMASSANGQLRRRENGTMR